MRFDKGLHLALLSPPTTAADGSHPRGALILLTDRRSVCVRISCLCSSRLPATGKPLLIIRRRTIERKPLPPWVVNRLRGAAHCGCRQGPPAFGDRRNASSKTSPFSPDGQPDPTRGRRRLKAGEQPKLEMLGTARRIPSTKTPHHRGDGNEVAVKARRSRSQADRRNDSTTTREAPGNAWAKLLGGVAVVRWAAATENEMKGQEAALEMHQRTRRLLREGPSFQAAGTTLAHLARPWEEWAGWPNLSGEELIACTIVASALSAPLMRIAQETPASTAPSWEQPSRACPSMRLQRPATGEYVDMRLAGIVDPPR